MCWQRPQILKQLEDQKENPCTTRGFHFDKPDQENFPSQANGLLSADELRYARAVIYPIVDIQMLGRSDLILGEQQEKLVAEPGRQEPVIC